MPASLWITTASPTHNTLRRIWLLQSGSMAVFAVEVLADGTEGQRRYLFRVSADEVLFEMDGAEDCSYRVVAMAIETPVLRELTWSQLEVGEPNLDLFTLASRWSQHLSALFAGTSLASTGLNPQIPLDLDELQATLTTLHHHFFAQLIRLEQQDQAQAWQRLQERERLNRQSAEVALVKLVDVFLPQTVDPGTADSALLIAAGAVGRRLGIKIQAPEALSGWEQLPDLIAAIAQASRIRTRRISLNSNWWQQDYGPLLAFTQDEQPVALLPTASGQYELFDPQTNQHTPIRARVAAQLAPMAYLFYRPLPDRALSSWDLLKFVSWGQAQNVMTLGWVSVAATVASMVTPLVTGVLIDEAIPDTHRPLLLQLGLGLFAASFGMFVFQFAQRRVLLRLQTSTDLTIQAAIWDRLLKLKPSFFRQYSTGDLQNRVSAIAQIRSHLSGTLLPALFTSLFSLLNLVLLFFFSFPLAGIAAIVAGVALWVNHILRLMLSPQLRALQELEGHLLGTMVQIMGGIAKLRVAGAENRVFAYWAQHYRQQLHLVIKTQSLEDGLTVFNTLLPVLSSMAFFGVASSLTTLDAALPNGLSTGTFLAFNAAFGAFMTGTQDLSRTWIELLQVGILWERILPILAAQPEVDESKADPGPLSGQLKLDRVTFRYRAEGPLILDQMTLEANKGDFIAVVGPSGSGKSTLIRLLLGFETPTQGTVSYDGQDLAELDLTAVRRQLGVVLQNGRITSASLFENIAAGALITLDQAWDAARLAALADEIAAMPMAMQTVISEGGSNLSGGQRQRLLIARALALKPKILLLDEATSALDNQTQAVISRNLEQMQVTRIAIAHRLSTIRHADRIYVLDRGRIVQQGTFEVLMTEPGLFARIMGRQVV